MTTAQHGHLRETPDEAGCRVVKTWPDVDRGCLVVEYTDGSRELWARAPNFAGCALVYAGVEYEFVRTLNR